MRQSCCICPLLDSFERQIERQGTVSEGREALEPVKHSRLFIFRLDDESEGFHIAPQDTEGGIGKKGAADPSALVALIDSKPTDKRGGEERVAREAFGKLRWQITGCYA